MRIASGRLLALCGLLLLCASASALSPPRFRALDRALGSAAARASAGTGLDPTTKLTSVHLEKIKLDTLGPKTKEALKVDATWNEVIAGLVADVGEDAEKAKEAITVIAAAVPEDNKAEEDLLQAYQLAVAPKQEEQQVEEEKENLCEIQPVHDFSSTIQNGIHFYSNEIAFTPKHGPNILSAVISAIKLAETSILIVSDKFMDSTVQAALVAAMVKNVKVTIITGSEKSGEASLTICPLQKESLEKYSNEGLFETYATAYQFPNDKAIEGAKKEDFSVDLKMHNKFMVIDDKLVLIGSPNYTPPGMGSGTFAKKDFNVESLVVVADKKLAEVYLEYGRIIQVSVGDPMFPHDRSFKNEDQTETLLGLLKSFDNSAIRPCLAPICNLYFFFKHHIHADLLPSKRGGINSIIVAQYLISSSVPWVEVLIPVIKKPVLAKVHGEDVDDYKQWVPEDQGIAYLLAEWGNKVTVYWDQKTYVSKNEKQMADNVKISNALIDKGANLFSVKMPKIFHNKLILIEYGDGTFTTIIGSAGFTYSVQQNMNCENMVAIDSKDLYDAVILHIEAFKKRRKFEPIEK